MLNPALFRNVWNPFVLLVMCPDFERNDGKTQPSCWQTQRAVNTEAILSDMGTKRLDFKVLPYGFQICLLSKSRFSIRMR